MTHASTSNSRFSIRDQVAIITGASRGIGRTTAEQFAQAGADVVICSREREHIKPVATAINRSNRPGDAIAVVCDVRNRESVDAVVETAQEEFGDIDILVNNAGGMFQSPFEDLSTSGWRALIRTNLDGVFHSTQAAAPALFDGGGAVINVASIIGEQGSAYLSPYGAAKAGVMSLTESLAIEWADRGVRVNCVSPGIVDTPGVKQVTDVTVHPNRSDPNRRIGMPEEIADIIRFLASPAASYITGEVITAKGVPSSPSVPEKGIDE